MAIDWGAEFGGNSPQQPDSAVSAIENNPEVAAQFAAIDRLQRAKDITKRQIDQMGQISSETPGGIFGRKWSYGGKVYTDQQIADAKSAVDRAQNDDEIYQAILNLARANDQSEVGTGVGGMLARGMNNTPIPSIGNNSFLGNNRTKYEYPEDDSSWAYTIGKYGGGGLELASDVSGAADTLKMAKAARFNPFTFAGMLYRDAKQTGKDIVNLPGNIVNGIRNAGNKTSNFVKDSIKAGTEGKSLKAYRTPASAETAAPAGETAQTGGRAAETAAPATERTAASETAAPAPRQEPAPAPQQPAPAPRQEPAPQQPAPAPRQEPAPAPRQEPAPAPRQEPAPAEGSPELRSNADGTPDLAGTINGEGTGAAGAAARQGAGEAAGSQLQKDLLAVRQKVSSEGDSFERIRDVLRTSAGRQELLPANIREACEPLRRIMEQGGGAALTPAEREAVQLYNSFTEAAAGAGRAGEAAGTAARQGAGEAAGAAARQGEGKATGTLSAYERQQYRNYINMVQNDSELVDLVPSTLHRVVGNAARSIDSLSDAELSAFHKALNDAVDERRVTSLFVGGL